MHYGCHLSVVGEDADFAAALFYAQLYVGCEVATGLYAIDVAVVLLRVFTGEKTAFCHALFEACASV